MRLHGLAVCTFAFTAVAASPALGEEWRKVSVDREGAAVMGVEVSRLRGPQNARYARIVTVLKQAQTFSGVAVDYMVSEERVDCTTRIMKTDVIIMYAGTCQIISNTTGPITKAEPKTVGWAVFEAVCQAKWLPDAPAASLDAFFRTQRAALLAGE